MKASSCSSICKNSSNKQFNVSCEIFFQSLCTSETFFAAGTLELRKIYSDKISIFAKAKSATFTCFCWEAANELVADRKEQILLKTELVSNRIEIEKLKRTKIDWSCYRAAYVNK